MEFRELEYFRAILKAGSFSRAAKALNMTQPPLSLAIAKLERELGVTLLDRTAKGVTPTPAGHFLLDNAERMLARRDRVRETLGLMGEGLIGELRIGAEPMGISELIGEAIAQFHAVAPRAHVRLLDVTPEQILAQVASGWIDIGCVPFGPDTFADFVHNEVESRPIARIDLMLAVPEARADEAHPDGRGWGTWVLPRRVPGFSGMPEAVESALGGRELYDVFEVTTPQTALALVAAGLGVSIATERMGRQQRGVVLRDRPWWLKPMQATLVWQKGAELTPLVERWIDVAADVGRRVGA